MSREHLKHLSREHLRKNFGCCLLSYWRKWSWVTFIHPPLSSIAIFSTTFIKQNWGFRHEFNDNLSHDPCLQPLRLARLRINNKRWNGTKMCGFCVCYQAFDVGAKWVKLKILCWHSWHGRLATSKGSWGILYNCDMLDLTNLAST